MDAAEAQSCPRALLLTPAGDPGWLADTARILRDLGFVVRTNVRAPEADMAAELEL
ncbi:MAG: hypothetical protein HOQ37_03110, partial [Cupriavidus sp.]|nr:hypothetical protein [Cupriavidus sp.]